MVPMKKMDLPSLTDSISKKKKYMNIKSVMNFLNLTISLSHPEYNIGNN